MFLVSRTISNYNSVMSTCPVQVLWNSILSYGRVIHQRQNADGRQKWERIKPQLQLVPGIGTWSSDFIKEFDPRGSLDQKKEDHHYLIQHFKIPSENDCSFVRLMQVSQHPNQQIMQIEIDARVDRSHTTQAKCKGRELVKDCHENSSRCKPDHNQLPQQQAKILSSA